MPCSITVDDYLDRGFSMQQARELSAACARRAIGQLHQNKSFTAPGRAVEAREHRILRNRLRRAPKPDEAMQERVAALRLQSVALQLQVATAVALNLI